MAHSQIVAARVLFDEHGHFRPIHTLPADVAALIASFEIVIKNAEPGDGHVWLLWWSQDLAGLLSVLSANQ